MTNSSNCLQVTLVKVANVFLLLLAATIFSTAILDEISGSEVAERVRSPPHAPLRRVVPSPKS